MSLTTIQNDFLKVTISDLGAEIQSIRDKDGVERLWQGDPAFWAGRAPIMFPICGGLKEDAYLMDGVRYPMEKHGFARKAVWSLEAADETSAVYLLTEKREGFPFAYELRARYALRENALTITYEVKNKDDRAFCFGIGSHEAYQTPGGLEACAIEFAQTERIANQPVVGNLIETEPAVILEQADRLPLKTEYFAVDALVFPHLKSRSVTLTSAVTDKKIRVDFEGMDVLMLWTKPGAGYICIEPWTNAPDYVDADMNIEHKPGVIRLEPGQTAVRSHTITVL